MQELIGLVAVVMVFGIPITAIVTAHFRQLAQMKMNRSSEQDQALLHELQAVKQQIEQLRDTTTQYDMSFDTALQRLESRMSHIEQRVNAVEQRAASPNTETQSLKNMQG
jgi:methylthioribose-1-phosphate isomerase